MEESYNNYEQEASRKRAVEGEENGEKASKRPNLGTQPLLKLLVPNYAAGALIGKGGSLLTELRSKYGGNLRLSTNKEFYPGTDERVVVITGEVNQIIDINNHIMEIVQGDPSKNRPQSIRDKQVKIVLTNFVAGLLIGKGGETVKAINEQSKAKLNITQREGSSVPGERLLTMSGSMDERTEGCKMVIEKIATDESNMKNTNLKYTDSGTGIPAHYGNNNHFAQSTQNATPYGGNSQFSPPTQNAMHYGNTNQFAPPSQNAMHYAGNNQFSPYGMDGSARQSANNVPLKTTVEVEIEVHDDLVTVLMGKQGQTIKELVQASGARFKFSDKNDFVPGTKNRRLTITGNMDQAKTAHSLVQQKVNSETGRQQGQQWGMY